MYSPTIKQSPNFSGSLPTNRQPSSPTADAPSVSIETEVLATGDEDESDVGEQPHGTRPHFRPFFALVEDSTAPGRPVHLHPSVHYIFSDDDSDLITEASLRAIQDSQASSSSSSSLQRSGNHQQNQMNQPIDSFEDGLLPPRRRGFKDRYIIVDIDEDGETVTSAQSLTHDWQVLGVHVNNAPTWDNGDVDDRVSIAGGLMLKIEGTRGIFTEDDVATRKEGTELDMQDLISSFERRMAVMRKVIESGEKVANRHRLDEQDV